MTSVKTGQQLSPARCRLFKFLAVSLSLLLCFVVAELVLKIGGSNYGWVHVWNNRLHCYDTNPRGYFDVLGVQDNRTVYGISYRSENRYHIKDWQRRQQPHIRVPDNFHTTEEKQQFVARDTTVLALGDSFTFGQGVRFEDIYLRRLERRLAMDGRRVAINNTAWPSYDLEEIQMLYQAASAEQHYPLVIYGFCLNDFDLPGKETIDGSDFIDFNNGENEYNPWRKRFATLNFISHKLEQIQLDRFTRILYLRAFEGANAQKGFQRLAELDSWIRNDDGTLVIVLFPLLYDLSDYPFQKIHDKIADFCRLHDIPLLDLQPSFSKHQAEQLWVHPMDHHPNETAHEIAANELHTFLKRQGLLDKLTAAEIQTDRNGKAGLADHEKP